MVPTLLLLLTAVALVATVVAVASGRVRVDGLADATRSIPDHGLPEAPDAADVDDVRFDTAPRGYAMADVDARLAELRATLAAREAEVAGLRAREED